MNIKTAPANLMTIEELVIATAYLGLLSERIHDNGHDVPDSIKSELRACERELDEKLRGDDERRLALLKQRREGLLTIPERRKSVEAEIDALESKLGHNKQAARKRG